MLDNSSILQLDLQEYFNYIIHEFNLYLSCVAKTYKLTNFVKAKHLSYNMRVVNQKVKNFTKNIKIKTTYQKIQGFKHQSLAIQMMLLREISRADTKNKIKKLCYNLTLFVCKPSELFCGYV